MRDDREGEALDSSLVVRFGGGEDIDVRELLDAARKELASGRRRVEAAEQLAGAQGRLEEWLAAEPGRAELLLKDPSRAIREAVPELELPELPAAGIGMLARYRHGATASILKYTPPEGLALELLRDVANDAAGGPGGYAALFADIQGTVTRVEAGRYGPDAITRVVDGISRSVGLTPSVVSTGTLLPALSTLAAYLAGHPDAPPEPSEGREP